MSAVTQFAGSLRYADASLREDNSIIQMTLINDPKARQEETKNITIRKDPFFPLPYKNI